MRTLWRIFCFRRGGSHFLAELLLSARGGRIFEFPATRRPYVLNTNLRLLSDSRRSSHLPFLSLSGDGPDIVCSIEDPNPDLIDSYRSIRTNDGTAYTPIDVAMLRSIYNMAGSRIHQRIAHGRLVSGWHTGIDDRWLRWAKMFGCNARFVWLLFDNLLQSTEYRLNKTSLLAAKSGHLVPLNLDILKRQASVDTFDRTPRAGFHKKPSHERYTEYLDHEWMVELLARDDIRDSHMELFSWTLRKDGSYDAG